MDYRKIEEFLKNYLDRIEKISKQPNLIGRFDDIRELGLRIHSLLIFVYPNNKEIPEGFMENYKIKLKDYSRVRQNRRLREILGYFKRVLNSTKDYIELKKSSNKDLELLEKIEKDVKFQKAETERRKVVKEAKEMGATIELIQTLRDELKRKSNTDNSINEMKAEIKEIKVV